MLPEFGGISIKAKIDTGARSSALHAINIELFELEGTARVRFNIAPMQHNDTYLVPVEAQLLGQRAVTDSGGHQEQRPLVLTQVSLGGKTWPIEVTLTNRDVMGFRMLLGRRAIRDRYWVDAGHSFLQRTRDTEVDIP